GAPGAETAPMPWERDLRADEPASAGKAVSLPRPPAANDKPVRPSVLQLSGSGRAFARRLSHVLVLPALRGQLDPERAAARGGDDSPHRAATQPPHPGRRGRGAGSVPAFRAGGCDLVVALDGGAWHARRGKRHDPRPRRCGDLDRRGLSPPRPGRRLHTEGGVVPDACGRLALPAAQAVRPGRLDPARFRNRQAAAPRLAINADLALWIAPRRWTFAGARSHRLRGGAACVCDSDACGARGWRPGAVG